MRKNIAPLLLLVSAATPLAVTAERLMTYEEALARALDDEGYRKFGQLTKSQKERVLEAMEKYVHLPPSPRQPTQNATSSQPQLLVNGVPATPVGGGNYIDNRTGHFFQGAAGGVIDTTTGEFLPTH